MVRIQNENLFEEGVCPVGVSQMLTAQSHVEQCINLLAMEFSRLFKIGQSPPIVLELKAKTSDIKGKIIIFTDGKVALPNFVDPTQHSGVFLGGKVRGELLQLGQVAGELVTVVMTEA